MPLDYLNVALYHITEIGNLPAIINSGLLLSDLRVQALPHAVIGYGHIKQRRLTQIQVPCCQNRFVGEFVPFYYCPRSPMLYSVNGGQTGKPLGHQREIVHLVTRVGTAITHATDWAISDGNAGAYGVSFFRNVEQLDALDWSAIRATQWASRTRQKQAEFLVADVFPWNAIERVGCYNQEAAERVRQILGAAAVPTLAIEPGWYY